MRRTRRLAAVGLAVAAAAAVLASFAGTAAAEPDDVITIAPSGRMAATGVWWIEGVECFVEFRGTWRANTTQASTEGWIGTLTSGMVSECDNGSITLLIEAESPWPIFLELPLPAAPALANIRIWLVQLRVNGIPSCLYAPGSVRGVLHGRRVESIRGHLVSMGGLFCSESIDFTGIFNLSPTIELDLS